MKTITLILATAIMVMLTANLNAQTFEIIKDLNSNGDSSPKNLTVWDNLFL